MCVIHMCMCVCIYMFLIFYFIFVVALEFGNGLGLLCPLWQGLGYQNGLRDKGLAQFFRVR